MPNGYVSQIQINGGDVQNIGSCAYAVCDTAEDVSVKVVTLPGFVLKDGATIHVKFTYRNTAFNPELNVNGTGAKSILLNTNLDFNSSISLSSQYNVDQLWLAGAIVTLTYDGTNWVVNNPSRITTPFAYNLGTGGTLEPDSYMILADIEWERCTSSSNVTARVFPFRICMSTMVDGVYRDRSAIMEVFVGGCYSKKDYVDIMIHDESEYHVNDDDVFRSLVDSIFIYFEYEVASDNVIGNRTGYLLGKVPARWSVFKLVPLTDMSVASANPDEDHHFLKFDIANSRSSFEPSETSQTSIPSGNVLPTTVGVHRYLIKARMKPFDVEQISGVLPINQGGTGATTALSAEYNILNQVQDINTSLTDSRKIALCNQTKSASNGVFRWIALSNVWTWIKSKLGTAGSSTHPIYMNAGVPTECNVAENYLRYDDKEVVNSAESSPLFNLAVKTGSINCIEGIRDSQIKVEYSTDGVTWSEMTDKEVKGLLCGGVTSIYTGGSSSGATNDSRTRVTIYAKDQYGTGTSRLYAEVRCIGIYFETRGASDNKIEIWTGKDEVYTKVGEYSIRGNAGWNSYPFNGRLSQGSNYWNSIRLVFRMDGTTGTNNYSPIVHCIRFLSSNVWTGEAWQGSSTPRMPVLLDSNGNRYYMLRGNLKLRASSGSIANGDVYLVTGNAVYQALLNKQDKLTFPLSVTNGGTGASDTKTARLNLLSDANEEATDASDGNLFAFRYQTPSADNGAIYYRTADKVWNWIIGKITAGTGLSKSGNTINHSNSVTAQTSNLGSYQMIPVIRYDAQGHITNGDYVSIFNNERTSTIKVGYISNGSSGGIGWYKVGQIDYWTGTYNRFTVLISMNGTSRNSHDYGLLRIRGVNAASAGTVTGIHVQWIMKTPETSNGFTTDCIRLTKSETGTSSGATLFIYMKLPENNLSYNFLVLNEAQAGNAKAFRISFANSTAKETTEPSPTYVSTMAPLILGNQSNCLEITDSNWQSYLTASNGSTSFINCDILSIPEGITSIFFSTQQTASIACIRGKETIGRFPRNGVRITMAGNWSPQENGGYAGGNAEGRFSQYLYDYRGGVAGMHKQDRLDEGFEDFMYFNGVWYSKGY